MKKLVLLLQNGKIFTHLELSLLTLFLANLTLENPIVHLCITSFFTVIFILYSYSSGFWFGFHKTFGIKFSNSLLFFVLFLTCFLYNCKLYLDYSFLFYLEKINLSQEEIKNLSPELNEKIGRLFWIIFIIPLTSTILRGVGEKQGFKVAQENTHQE